DVDASANLVNKVVLADLVRSELGEVEFDLLATLARPGHRDEVLARAAARHDLVRDAVVVEPEMLVRQPIRGVDDRVVDDPIRHQHRPRVIWLVRTNAEDVTPNFLYG